MNPIEYKITLDCRLAESQVIITAKQGEASGRKITFSLNEGRLPYKVPAGVTAVLRAKKPSGAVLYNTCTVTADGNVEYTITTQTVAEVGKLPCELQLSQDGKVIFSPNFTLLVYKNLSVDSEVESSDEFTALQDAINRAENLAGGALRVNVTYSNGIHSADKTFDEIKAAYDAGQQPYVVVTGGTLDLVYALAYFSVPDGTGQDFVDFERYLIGDDTLKTETLRIYSYTLASGSNIEQRIAEFNAPSGTSGTTYIAVDSTDGVISTVNGETYADIQALINAGKLVVVRYNDVLDFYYFETLEFSDSSGIHTRVNFRCVMGSIVSTLTLRDDNNWALTQTSLQTSSITDSGGYFTTDTVEGALQEIGAGLAGTYSKPAGGIPESDLSFDVKTKLNSRETNIITIDTENADPLNPYRSSKTLTAIKNDFTHNIEQFVFYDNISYKLEKIITDTGVEKAVFYSTARLVNDVLTYYTCEIYEGNFGYSAADFHTHTYTVTGGGAVESVNGKTGAVVLNAEDVGAQRTLIAGSGITIVESEDGDIIQSDAAGGSGTVSFVDVAGGAPIAQFTLNQTEDCEINVNDLIQTPLLNNYRTAAAQDVIDAGKQDKLIAGEGITIAADGKTISSSGKVSSVNGKTGDVVLNAEDVGAQRPLIAGSGISIVWREDGDVIQSDASGGGGNGVVSFVDVAGGAPIAQFTLNQTEDCEINVNDLIQTPLLNNYRTAAAQDVIDAGKQDKLIAGEGITIAADGKTISSSGKVSSVNGKTGAVNIYVEDIHYVKESQSLDATIGGLKAADAQMASDISELQTADASLDSRVTAIETGDTPVTLYIYWESVTSGGRVSLTRNGAAMSVADFISKMQSGAKIIIGENNDTDSESSGFSNYRYKITDSTTASLAFDVANSFNGSNRTIIISGSSSTNGLMTGYQDIGHDDLSDYSPLPEGSTPASKAWVENFVDTKLADGATPATVEKLGSVRIGENLKITKDGILSVDTANAVEQDNTKPITSAAVHVTIGNIEALLAAL